MEETKKKKIYCIDNYVRYDFDFLFSFRGWF